jgi:hypothetical protein
VKFKGKRFAVSPVTQKRLGVLSAIRSGALDHVGSLSEQICPNCSAFQVYDSGAGALIAAACSSGSQHIDTIYWLTRIS